MRPNGLSGPLEAWVQAGAGAVRPRGRANGGVPPARGAALDGCTAAAPVETGAAADNKNRRGNAPGVVVKVAVAMMLVLDQGHRG